MVANANQYRGVPKATKGPAATLRIPGRGGRLAVANQRSCAAAVGFGAQSADRHTTGSPRVGSNPTGVDLVVMD